MLGSDNGDDRHAFVGDGCRDNVDEHELAEFAGSAPRVGKRAAREQGTGEAAAQKAGAAGDDNAHETSVRSMRCCGRLHPTACRIIR